MESCPKCGNSKLKRWDELDREEQMLVEKLPLNVEFSIDARRAHLFCNRCWFEFVIEPGSRNELI